MARDEERAARALERPVVGGLPEMPGILVAMRLSPSMMAPLRSLADALLVDPFPGTTLTRGDREIIATFVSGANDCFYCMDSHGAFATELLARDGAEDAAARADAAKTGALDTFDPKLRALCEIARVVQRRSRDLTAKDVAHAKEAGATDADIQLRCSFLRHSVCITEWSTA